MSVYLRGSGPLYWQVAAQIEEGIRAGTWLPGDKLPSERALCDMYHVSQITVRRALRELAHQSKVYSRHGLGWYVEEKAFDAGGQGLHRDVAILVPAQDELIEAVVATCISHFGALGQIVDVLYFPPAQQELPALPADLAETPLLWAVSGEEQELAARYAALAAEHKPHSLLLGRSVEGLELPAVGIDEQAAVAQVTEHLISRGHRRIAYVGSDPILAEGWRRYRGFAASMWDHGLEFPLEWVFSVATTEMATDGRFERVMAGSLRPTAVVCSSDTLAALVIHRLASVGLSCPSDVAVAGVGDASFGALLAEPLTSFRFDLASLARQAVDAVDAVRAGREPQVRPVTGELVVRTSCGALSGRMMPVHDPLPSV
ncbi:MAG: GntR family transcriptional regulator [Anaerolineae bacterium]